MNKNKIRKLLLVLSFLILPTISFAANYALLEPLQQGSQTTVTKPMDYIRNLYWFVIGLTIALSVLMLIVGGFEYTLTWASESKKGEAKNRIDNAITGLIIALTSYLLLFTINPNLVRFELSEAGGVCPASGAPTTPAPVNTTTLGNPTGGGTIGPADSYVPPPSAGNNPNVPAGYEVDQNTGQLLAE